MASASTQPSLASSQSKGELEINIGVSESLTQEQIELAKYEAEMNKQYWFPHYFKYIAWFLTIGVIVSACIVLFLYGVSFGEEKSKLWLITVFTSMALSLFLIQPIKVLVVAAISSYVFKWDKEVAFIRMRPEFFSNPPDEKKLKEVMAEREELADCYLPPDPAILKEKRMEFQRKLKYRSLIFDGISYLIFMIVLYTIVILGRTENGYHSRRVISNLISSADYTSTIPLGRILTYEQFVEYLNETIITSLITSDDDVEGINSIPKNETEEPIDEATGDAGRSSSAPNFYERLKKLGWTLEGKVKLIGTIRLRQKRVRNSTCYIHPSATNVTRTHDCDFVLNLFNEDKDDYAVGWRPFLSEDPGIGGGELEPWKFRSFWDSGSFLIEGKISTYTGSGYSLNLGRSKKEAYTMMQHMTYFGWVDRRTRVVFIEFTTYSVDSNLFNVVTVVIEITATGSFIPSLKVRSIAALDGFNESIIAFLIMLGALLIICILFGLRETIRMKRARARKYFTNAWAMLDLMIYITGFIAIALFFARSYYIENLMNVLEATSHKKFESFHFAAELDNLAMLFSAILVFLATFKSIRLLTHLPAFYDYQKILKRIMVSVVAVLTFIVWALTAFGILLYLILMTQDGQFRTIYRSMFELVALMTRQRMGDHPSGDDVAAVLVTLAFTIVVALAIALLIAVVMRELKVVSPGDEVPKMEKVNDASTSSPTPSCITLKVRDEHKENETYGINEVRFEGMKRIALELLTKKSYLELTAYKIIDILISKRANKDIDEKSHLANVDGKELAIPNSAMVKMKEVADSVVSRRNATLLAQIEAKNAANNEANRRREGEEE